MVRDLKSVANGVTLAFGEEFAMLFVPLAKSPLQGENYYAIETNLDSIVPFQGERDESVLPMCR